MFYRWYLPVLLFAVMLSGCGRYLKPVAPELLAPEAVHNLVVRPGAQGVAFSWRASEKDLQGNELKEIKGYRVVRKTIRQDSDITNPEVLFETVAFLPDTHIARRQELRRQAEMEGRSTRQISVDESLVNFVFTDTGVVPGGRYVYQIVPVSEEDVDGESAVMILLTYRGEASELLTVPRPATEDELIL